MYMRFCTCIYTINLVYSEYACRHDVCVYGQVWRKSHPYNNPILFTLNIKYADYIKIPYASVTFSLEEMQL